MIRQEAVKNRPPLVLCEPGGRQRRARVRRPFDRIRCRRRARSACARFRRRLSSSTTSRSWSAGAAVAAGARRVSVAEEEASKALTLGLRDYARKCGFSKVVARPVGGHRFGRDGVSRRGCARAQRGDRRRDAEPLFVATAAPTRQSSRDNSVSVPGRPDRQVFQSYLDALAPAFAGLGARRD